LDLILVRHGLPQMSRTTADPPLSEEGRDQAARVGAFLQGEPLDAIWSSTMVRAVTTAQPLAERLGLSVRTHDGICEYDRHSGHYIPDEVLRVENYEAWRAQAAGDHGYDMASFRDAVVAGMEAIIAEHPGERVAVFCHGGVINVWTAHVLGLSPRLFFTPGYTSLNRYACSRRGHRGVVSLNEQPHLPERT
jgi:probable phosphoglycerate mutase